MRAYGSEIHRAAGGAGKGGRKRGWTEKVGGSYGRCHQDCGICHPDTKNKTKRARRTGKNWVSEELVYNP
jgi:hypothetical protein